MSAPLRIAQVAPVATSVPPPLSGSIESATSLLTEGLVRAGHDVTLFATGASRTSARLHATFPAGYRDDDSMWPWELCELFNIAAAVERAGQFDIIHYQSEYYPMSLAFSRLTSTPVVQTLHHAPDPAEVALWSRYPDAPFIAISRAQAAMLTGLNVAAGNATLSGSGVNLARSETAANGNLSLTASAGDVNLAGATTSALRRTSARGGARGSEAGSETYPGRRGSRVASLEGTQRS